VVADPISPDEAEERPGEGGGRELTIMEHLKELRDRMFWSAIAVVCGTTVGLFVGQRVIRFLEEPAKHAYKGFQLVQLAPLDFLGSYFKVGLLCGLTLAMPVLVYQGLAFVVPALTRNERIWLFPIMFGAFGLFLVGVVFAYFVVVPRALDFLLNFGSGEAVPTYRVSTYIDFVVRIVFWTGLMFELPILMMAPAKFGVVSARRYLKWWRYAIVGGFVAAAAVIPNISPVEQISVALPIIGLYFIGCGLAWLVQPKVKTPAE
jgi:sec-independent protein translocase protein TatC